MASGNLVWDPTYQKDGAIIGRWVEMVGNSAKSSVNTSTKLLSSGATFTGEFEQNDFPNVGVSCHSDIAGTLFFDFSNDGTNVNSFPPNGFSVTASIHEFHTAVKLGRYFRTRFVMAAGTQTFFRLYTYYGQDFFPSSTPVNIAMGIDVDSTIVRVSNNTLLDLARGFVGGQSTIHKFGENPSITASSTEDINFPGVINWLTAATTVRVKAGGNAADASGGNGARSITIQGLDENFVDASEDVIMNANGTLASDATTTTFIRVFRAFVLTTGTYTGTNTGDIVVENSGGGTDLVTIAAGIGQTETTAYTIPAGKTAYLSRVGAEVDAAKAVDMKMFQRQDADNISAPFTSKRLIIEFPALIGPAERAFDAYPMFPAKTDLWWTGTTGSGAAPAAEADYDLFLVDN